MFRIPSGLANSVLVELIILFLVMLQFLRLRLVIMVLGMYYNNCLNEIESP